MPAVRAGYSDAEAAIGQAKWERRQAENRPQGGQSG
jgi:hypothetical protein